MRKLLFLSLLVSTVTYGQDEVKNYDLEKIHVKTDNLEVDVIKADPLFEEGWSELAQPNFWRQIMTLSPDSCIVNIAATREIIAVMSKAEWNKQSDTEKNTFRDSVRTVRNLESDSRIFVTTQPILVSTVKAICLVPKDS